MIFVLLQREIVFKAQYKHSKSLAFISHVRPDLGRPPLYHALRSSDRHGHAGKLLSAVRPGQCHCRRRNTASTSAPLDCSLLCFNRVESLMVYADILPVFKPSQLCMWFRGYKTMMRKFYVSDWVLARGRWDIGGRLLGYRRTMAERAFSPCGH